jgi:hypothetical protein
VEVAHVAVQPHLKGVLGYRCVGNSRVIVFRISEEFALVPIVACDDETILVTTDSFNL